MSLWEESKLPIFWGGGGVENSSFQFCMRSFIVALLINLVSGIAMTQRCPADLLGFDVSIGAFKFNHRTLFLF